MLFFKEIRQQQGLPIPRRKLTKILLDASKSSAAVARKRDVVENERKAQREERNEDNRGSESYRVGVSVTSGANVVRREKTQKP